MFKRILLPTDGSEQSERAIQAGVGFAKELGAEVVGLAAMPEFHTFTLNADMLEDSKQQFAVHAQQQAEQHLRYIVEAGAAAGVPCTCELVTSDDPHDAIIATARKRQCDLVVMASHGRKGIKGVLLGSETQKVLVNSSIPVLVFR